MKIWVYTLCYNEMKILPYVVNYWKKYADRVIVYDNESTDGSTEFLNQFDWIEVRTYSTGNKLADAKYLEIKNNAWKEARDHGVDFVQVCDLDEVLYSERGVKNVLEEMKQNGTLGTLASTNTFLVVSDMFPTENINEETFHKTPCFRFAPMGASTGPSHNSKFLLFNPNKIQESNYFPGCHVANMSGDVRVFEVRDICVLHFCQMGFDFVRNKFRRNERRLSDENKRMGWGIHYTFDDQRIKADNDMWMSISVPIDKLFEH